MNNINNIGKKIAGVKFNIFNFVKPIIFKPKPISNIEPTQITSVITSTGSKGSKTNANKVNEPCISNTGILESNTPAPNDDPSNIEVIPSRILFV